MERKYNPLVHMMAGAAAGASAAAITTPLDVIKTLLNTQETGLTKGMIEATKKVCTTETIYEMESNLDLLSDLRHGWSQRFL